MSIKTQTAAPQAETIQNLDALNQFVDPLLADLNKLPLKVWIEYSRYGSDPRFLSGGKSNSYYIHVRGGRKSITLRVSDHGLSDVVVGMAVPDVKRKIASLINRAKRMKPYDAKSEKRQRETKWKREANHAFTGGDADVLAKVKDFIVNRDRSDDAEQERKLEKIADEDIQAVINVLNEFKREAGLPTFDQMLGAYAHVEMLRSLEYLMGERTAYGNDEAGAWPEQLEWTRHYYEERFPEARWEWQNKHAPDDAIGWLLDEVMESIEDDGSTSGEDD
jgi:hypothetical protein